ASDNLSTKCSGLLLRSSFAILDARARHLFSVAPMPAFPVASWPSNSSDIVRSSRRSVLGSPVERTRFNVVPGKLHLAASLAEPSRILSKPCKVRVSQHV